MSVASGAVVISLLIVSVFHFIYRADDVIGATIADDVKQLANIFDRINKQCGILGFDNQQNPINFLNVGSFAGSEVGSMNLAYPDKWQGPYLKDNLAVQSIEYMIVKTTHGYFITPGNGIQLPTGRTVGKDLVLDEEADIPALMASKKGLLFKGRPLAAPIAIYTGANDSFADAWRMSN